MGGNLLLKFFEKFFKKGLSFKKHIRYRKCQEEKIKKIFKKGLSFNFSFRYMNCKR